MDGKEGRVSLLFLFLSASDGVLVDLALSWTDPGLAWPFMASLSHTRICGKHDALRCAALRCLISAF